MNDAAKKTICFFNSNRAWGGGEKWHFTTCKEFQRRGFNTFLVTNLKSELSKKAIQEKLNVFGFRIGNMSFLNPIKLLVLAMLFKSKKVDAVVLNLPADLKVAGLAAKLAGVKKIIYRRGMPHPLRNTWLNRFLFTKVLTHVVVNSKEIGRSLKQGNESWFPEDKMVLIYNGVDTSKPIDTTRKMFEKKGEEIIIGNAGRLTEQKGQKYLIEMAKLLKADGVNFRLLIAGEGELRESLQQMINDSNLQSEVKILGHVDDMPGFFNSLDVFVFTSLYEGSANTLIETLQYGVPTIAWDVSSNPEVVVDSKTGVLIKPFDTKVLKEKVLYLITEQNIASKLKKNGRDLINSQFDSRNNLNSLETIFN